MKKILMSVFILSFFCINAMGKQFSIKPFFCYAEKKVQDTTLAYLLSLDLQSYHGKPVDSLLQKLPNNFIYREIAGWGNFYYARVLFVRYADSSLLAIFVKNFTHMQQYSATRVWDQNLFKKEIIYCISFSHKGILLKPDEECDPYN